MYSSIQEIRYELGVAQEFWQIQPQAKGEVVILPKLLEQLPVHTVSPLINCKANKIYNQDLPLCKFTAGYSSHLCNELGLFTSDPRVGTAVMLC